MSADHYHGMSTPAPGTDPRSQRSATHDGYAAHAQVSRLGVPPPAVTSRAMKEASKKVADQTREVFGQGGKGQSPGGRPSTRGYGMPRAASPAPARSASPQPAMNSDVRYRSASPNPYGSHQRNQSMPQPRGSDQGYYRGSSPNADYGRPRSSYGGADMAVQLAPVGDDRYGSQRGRGSYDKPTRQRSKSVAGGPRHYSRDGRPVLHYGKFDCSGVEVIWY